MRNLFKTTLAGLATGVCALASISAQANSITVTEISATPVVGGTDWTYDLSFVNDVLTAGSAVNPIGSFVTINDFGPGALVSITAPTGPGVGWVFSQAGTGPNSEPVTDNPGILNSTLTWTGPNVVVSPNSSTVINEFLVLFSPQASATLGALTSYTTIDTVASGLAVGTADEVVGSVLAPLPQVTLVPDGGLTMALLGFAFVGVEGLRRKLAPQ